MKPRSYAKTLTAAVTLATTVYSGAALAAHATSCTTVRFSDVGWTDITSTTAMTSEVLKGLGYKTHTDMLSVPVTYQSQAKGDIDVFLGNWMPTMKQMIKPYVDKQKIEIVRTNLKGAKYTLAVPQYVYDAGVHSFADIAKNADKFHNRIYGIEAGNDGNLTIQKMIDNDAFDLGDFKIVESSEAGMLSQVKRATRRDRWIVFLGWEPHPMNTQYKMKYLDGGDDYFGPNYGGAIVQTSVRKGYMQQCPNVGHLLKNLSFSLTQENEVMNSILNKDKQPREAARSWLKAHPEVLANWLDGVETTDGKPGLAAVKTYLNL